jgi:Undecaprenyl-phosphate glucose phosphotransferase
VTNTTAQTHSFARAADTQAVVGGVVRACDFVIVVGSGLLAYELRHGSVDMPAEYLIAIIVGALLTLNYMHFARVYRFNNLRRPQNQIGPLTAGWIVVILSLIALAYFTKTSGFFSRAWVAMWLSMSYGGFLALRVVVAWQIEQWRREGRLSVNVAIIGSGSLAHDLAEHLTGRTDTSFAIVGIFSLADENEGQPRGTAARLADGDIDDLVLLAQGNAIDDIVVALPWTAAADLARVMKKLHALPVDVRLAPETLDLPIPPRGFSSLAGVPMLDLYERPLSGWSLILKAIEDRILAALILVMVLPLLAVIAILVRLGSPGPALFRQRRYGFNNNEITIFKFRTMRWKGDGDGDGDGDADVVQATRHDPRVTSLGGFLRRTSLDELPQLFNVLRGDMSLVGPRPHAVVHNQMYAEIIDDYLSRHRVKPGITGWAQVNGLRGETDTPEKMRARVRYDLYYIDHWSLLFDLKILFLTIFVGFVNKHAY